MTTITSDTFEDDAWRWWQSRRLPYNIALAVAGWAAYFTTAGLFYAFDKPIWPDWRIATSLTLSLGILYLLFMFAANLCFLFGPWTESLLKPENTGRYRTAAWRMGLWGSLALPFAFPALNFCMLLAGAGG